jgi:hypothetical protein
MAESRYGFEISESSDDDVFAEFEPELLDWFYEAVMHYGRPVWPMPGYWPERRFSAKLKNGQVHLACLGPAKGRTEIVLQAGAIMSIYTSSEANVADIRGDDSRIVIDPGVTAGLLKAVLRAADNWAAGQMAYDPETGRRRRIEYDEFLDEPRGVRVLESFPRLTQAVSISLPRFTTDPMFVFDLPEFVKILWQDRYSARLMLKHGYEIRKAIQRAVLRRERITERRLDEQDEATDRRVLNAIDEAAARFEQRLSVVDSVLGRHGLSLAEYNAAHPRVVASIADEMVKVSGCLNG